MNNQELVKTKIARANSTKHSEDWGLQFWEDHLETEEAKKLIWNHSPQLNESKEFDSPLSHQCGKNNLNIGKKSILVQKEDAYTSPLGADTNTSFYLAKVVTGISKQIEQMFGGKQ